MWVVRVQMSSMHFKLRHDEMILPFPASESHLASERVWSGHECILIASLRWWVRGRKIGTRFRSCRLTLPPSLLFSSSPSSLPFSDSAQFIRIITPKRKKRAFIPRPRPRHAALIQPLHFEIRSAVKKSRQLLIVTGSQ